MKNGLRDVDGVAVGFSVGEASARVLVGFGLIGATFAVIPNFETADCVLVDVVLPLSRGTVSSDDVDDADFDFVDVYDANLIKNENDDKKTMPITQHQPKLSKKTPTKTNIMCS